MTDKINILNELKKTYQCKNDASFARFLGISPQTLATWFRRGTFNIDLLYSKCDNVNADFLLSGNPPVLRSQQEVRNTNNNSYECRLCVEKERTILALNQVIEAQALSIKALQHLLKESDSQV